MDCSTRFATEPLMGRKRKEDQAAERPRRGRPARVPEEARSNRVVTFVTGRELEALEHIAQEEDRSLSAVVHRIIAQHFAHQFQPKKKGAP